MLTRRRPGVGLRGTWSWLYVRAVLRWLMVSPRRSLQLIQHLGKGALDSQRLLDLVGRDVRILAVFDDTRTLMLADEPDEGLRVRLPVRRETLEILEDRVEAGLSEDRDRVLGVFVEVG